jgi:chromosome segregation ATPase
MSNKVELELLRRLDAMAKERDEALADIETLKLHVETLREAWRSASDEVKRLRAEVEDDTT